MTKDELIAKQQLEIEQYKIISEHNSKLKKQLHGRLFACGQPLNDNFLQFDKEQIKWCFKLLHLIEQINTEPYEEPTDDEQ